jgi:hypothetical protein
MKGPWRAETLRPPGEEAWSRQGGEGEGEGEVKVSIHPLMNQVLISLIPNRDPNKTSDW